MHASPSTFSGRFITLEGGEGAGKTTQINLLREALQEKGYDVVITREPGGTTEAEAIRTLLVTQQDREWTVEAETLLLFAARSMHLRDLILPELEQGKIVLCDRFTDSTRVYQGYGREMDKTKIETIKAVTIGDFEPDLTLLCDIPAEKGLSRSLKRLDETGSNERRYEEKDLSFHETLRRGFLELANKHSKRIKIIDADRTVDDIHLQILQEVMNAV